MNLLLFARHELEGSRLRLTDRRARHILTVLRLQPGDSLRLGMINGGRGSGRVCRVEGGCVELDVTLTAPGPAAGGVKLILALPRPIMLRRVLKQATVLGVRRFHLIRSRRVQKSFFQTTLLQPDNLEALLVQGLEQAMDTRLPEVFIHHRFKPFIEDVVPALVSGCRLFAHPDEPATLPDLFAAGEIRGDPVLAIGPEGGWSDYEAECFKARGFRGFSMGSRILHVDTAVVALLAQLQLLRDLHPESLLCKDGAQVNSWQGA
ncbi:16S ribosomal RNA methyltransferase RsmE [bacterium BMS3Bbin14]|nr:16S ribosomal RNA methyltransferase RsmE [bacterium BMS3Bbin14]